jgi:hypothetical protein
LGRGSLEYGGRNHIESAACGVRVFVIGIILGKVQNKSQAVQLMFRDRMIKYRKKNILIDSLFIIFGSFLVFILNSHLADELTSVRIPISALLLFFTALVIFHLVRYISNYDVQIYQNRILVSIDTGFKLRYNLDLKDINQVILYPDNLIFEYVNTDRIKFNIKSLDDPVSFIDILKPILEKNGVDFDSRLCDN